MDRLLVTIASAVCLLAFAASASAQLAAAKDGAIVYGHHHLNVASVDAQKKFLVDTLGGKAITIGTNNTEVIEFPGVLVFLRQQVPTGGSRGTTVNHIGFSVPSLRPIIDRLKANGYHMVTREEAVGREVKDDIAAPLAPGGASIAFVIGPDDLKVEFVEVPAQAKPIALHHVHFFNPKNAEMQAWYVKVFGAAPGTGSGGAFLTGALPGVSLNFSPSADPVVGTQGRALDHVGFEVKNLEEFCRKLEAQGIKLERPYTKVAALGVAVAFIRDPWGTYIELTEGLDKVS